MLAWLAVATLAQGGALPAPRGDVLTLAQAIRHAIDASPQAASARHRLEQARERTREVWAGVYPQLSLGSSLYRLDFLGGSGGIGVGGLGSGPGTAGLGSVAGGLAPDGGAGPSGLGGLGGIGGLGYGGAGGLPAAGTHQIQAQAQVTQVLFDGMRTQSGLQLADLQERAGLAEVEGAGRKAAIEAGLAYFQTLRAEALLGLAQRATAQARHQLERAEIRLRSGAGMQLDVLQAKSALASFRVQQSAASNAARRARVGLSALLGRSVEVVPLADTELPKAEVSLGRDLPAAIAARTEIRQLDFKIATDRELATQHQRSAWPTASAFGQLSWQGGGGSRYDLLGIQASWPIFDAGKVQARVAQARAELAADQATRDGIARGIEAEIRRALLDRADARERVMVASEGHEAASEALRLAEIRHQTGGGTMFDVSDAHQAVVRAESDRIQALYEVELAELRLAQALGVPLSNLGLPAEGGQ